MDGFTWAKHFLAMASLQKLAGAYRNFAIHFLNTAILGLIAFAIYKAVLLFRSPPGNDDPIKRYGIAELMAGYPGRTTGEVVGIMKETYDRPLVFAPYTHFREMPSKGQFVNIAEEGYRCIQDQGPWPIEKQNFNVFVFGGSTTFGAGVADSETIPSALQKELSKRSPGKVCVYNFGRGFHYSSQERVLFSNLLAAGDIPNAVVFFDGLNEFYHANDEPQYSSQFMALINQSLQQRKGDQLDVSDALRKRTRKLPSSREEKAAIIVQRYLRNKTTIGGMAEAHGIRATFVWQPVPVYKFDLAYHPFAKSPAFVEHEFPGVGYRYFAELRKTNSSATNLVWLADMQESSKEQLYVDAVHYTAKMCNRIAEQIAQAMEKNGSLPKR